MIHLSHLTVPRVLAYLGPIVPLLCLFWSLPTSRLSLRCHLSPSAFHPLIICVYRHSSLPFICPTVRGDIHREASAVWTNNEGQVYTGRMSKKTLKLYECLLSTLPITNTAYISYRKDNQLVNEAKIVTLSKSKSNDFFKELPIFYLAFIENDQADFCSLTMQIWSRCCSIVSLHVFD